jgi:two-component system NtrC family sensor kinase
MELEAKSHILYLDDEQNNLNVFQATFRHFYFVHTTINPIEAMEIIKNNPIEVILTDQRMPEMTGVDFLEKVRELNPNLIRIIVSAYTDVESIIQAINTGKVFYYITKPWSENEVRQIIDGSIRIFRLENQNRTLFADLKNNQIELKELNDNLEIKIQERTKALEMVQQQLYTTAHMAGMSQVATNVIHNVGNILTSINVSVDIVLNQLNYSTLSNLKQCSKIFEKPKNELLEFIGKDSKGALVPEYIINLTQSLQEEHENYINEIQSIQKNIQIVNHIITTQQSLTGSASQIQEVDVLEIIEEALNICSSDIVNYNITIKREFEKLNRVTLNKIKLLQILINLIANARDSLIASSKENKIITLILSSNSADKFQIKVCDNGVGIDHAHLKNIFLFGFTTKSTGHGFGLHSCVTTIAEMKGTITVASAGLEKGACFTIELPYNMAPMKKD